MPENPTEIAEEAVEEESIEVVEEEEVITSSMYIDSLIEKERQLKFKSIKLKDIDDISKLIEFENLRRVKLHNMTGKEELSVIAELPGVNELIIEDSIMFDQFDGAVFENVTNVELYNCVVTKQKLLEKFPRLQRLYVYDSQFMSKDGALNILEYTPKLNELTLSKVGEFDKLPGAGNLDNLRSMYLTNGTIISDLSYLDNESLQSVKVDMTFVKDIAEFMAFGNKENLKTINLQIDKEHRLASQISRIEKWIERNNEQAKVSVSTY